MKCELTLEIRDLHACPADRPPKEHIITKEVFSQDEQELTEETLDEDLTLSREKGKKTKKKRTKIEPLRAFKIIEGKPVTRLGGPYGKLMGLFKNAGKSLYAQKDDMFYPGNRAYLGFLKSLIVTPQWVELEEASEIEIAKIPQIIRTKGGSQSMIFLYHEKLPHCYVKVTIQLPAGEKERFEKLLEQAEGMPFGPKRRAEITVHKKEWI